MNQYPFLNVHYWIGLTFLFLISTPLQAQIYVDADAADGGDGTSWATAYNTLQDALADAESGDQIWVAEGVYYPDEGTGQTNDDRTATFQLIDGVEIYGGFSGTEEPGYNLENRDFETNTTILSGDIDGDDDAFAPETDSDSDPNTPSQTDHINGDNSYHVVNGTETDNTAILDGFTIKGGLANEESDLNENGGGMLILGTSDLGNPILANLVFAGNSAGNNGGGIFNSGKPTLTNVAFTGNSAFRSGGGMYISNDATATLTTVTFTSNSAEFGGGVYHNFVAPSPTLTNVAFTNNSASDDGGGMFNNGSSPTLTNVIFIDNTATEHGGGMLNNLDGSSPTLTNVTFTGNSAENGGGMYNNLEGSSPTLANTILWGNTAGSQGNEIFNNLSATVTLNYSLYRNRDGEDDIIEDGGFTATNSLTVDPQFSDPGNGDFALSNTSPAINMGDPSTNLSLFPGGPSNPTDLAGNPRVFDGDTDLIDMGAYEFQGEPNSSEPLASPQLISPSNEATDVYPSVTLDWDAVESAESYHVQLVEESGSFETPGFDSKPSNTNIGIGLEPLTEYKWRVRSLAGEDESEWSEVWTFTTRAIPEGSNQRILVGNGDDYEFSGDDFGVSNADFSIRILYLPDEGELEYDGVAVEEDDKVSISDINAGMLTWTPPLDEYGYDFTYFDFAIIDDSDVESYDYTMKLDVAATSVELTGGEGWRFLASPVNNETLGDFLAPIWTQGFTGSDSPGASFTNVQFLDQGNYQWDPADNATNPMSVGQTAIVYVYSNDDNTGSNEGFPKTLTSSTMDWEPLDGTFGGALFYDDQQDGEDNDNESIFLLGNPHPIGIDFCQTTRNNVADNIDVWDPNLNDGDYRNLSCSSGDVEIAPFQGYWVRVESDGNNYVINEDSYLEGPASGYFKQGEPSDRSERTDGFIVELNVRGEQSGFTNTTRILLSEKGTLERDLTDAPKLSPVGLARRYLSFYSLDGKNRPYALQDFPQDMFSTKEKLSIPLDIATTESGHFTLDWSLPASHVFGGSYYLKDNQTGEVVELREGSSYTFEMDPSQTSKVSEPLEVLEEATLNLDPETLNPNPRFELLIAASGTDGLSELGAVPETFELAQNYPNPFNPTTVINYQLPVSGEVRLEVYDMLGRNVATLVNGQVSAGRHTVNFDASNLSSGIYLYRLQAGSQIMTRKLTVVK